MFKIENTYSSPLRLNTQIPSGLSLSSKKEAESQTSFSDLFVAQLNQTNQLQHQADVEVQQFLTGESDNIHNVTIALEEAQIALELTTQVRNKIVEAYQELKNIQL